MFLGAWWRICAAAIGLRFLGLRRTLEVLAAAPAAGFCSDRRVALQAARWVRIAARNVPGRPRCLTRSIALHSLLARERVASALRIGVTRTGAEFGAHAWVEVDGISLDEAKPEQVPSPFAAPISSS